MRSVSEDKILLIDNSLSTSRKCNGFLRRSKSNSVLKFITALIIFMLVILLIVRALDVIPIRINVFCVSKDTLSSLKIDIQFVGDKSIDKTGFYLEQGVTNPACGNIPDNEKFDCFPEGNVSEVKCQSRGCCWKVVEKESTFLPPLGTPYCYYPTNYNGYEVQNVSVRSDGFIMKLQRQQPSGYPKDIKNAVVNVTYLDNNRLRLKVYDADNKRYEVPVPVIKYVPGLDISDPKYKVNYDNQNLWISRQSTGTVLFNTSLTSLVFANQMLQMSIRLPSHYVYGISEVKDKLLRGTDWKRYILFSRDRVPSEKMNSYGSHPLYLVMENDGNSHGVLLLNSNPMEVVIQPTPAITFRPIGGVLDLYISTGPSPSDVVQQYTSMIGRTFMPPYWSLGFHLCRNGYNSVNKTREVWQRTRDHGIPLDTQWNDIDHMDKYNDFTINDTSYADLPKFVQELHDYNMHYIMIIDPGISNAEPSGTYPPYDDGVAMDIFIKNISGEIQIGKVWNRVSTVFPDFTNPKTVIYWTKQFNNFHKLIPFDGVWIDMNEPSNFVDGSIYGCPGNNSLEDPPYVPGGIEPLRSKTLCMTSKQYASDHYNVHNLYGLTELIATNKAIKDILKKRPFIITRSTFPSSGHYGGHWDGDIYSSWDHMRWTIPSILTMNMLGISMAGADICGFNGNTTVELCARWSALGAFYPFARNHNSRASIEQDPVALGEEVISSAKHTLTIRYGMLPILYTLFYRSHVFGETVVRPIFFEFPNDKQTYSLDQQFMWGSHILIVPALQEDQVAVTGYLPKGRWFPYAGQTGNVIISQGENFTFPTPLNSTNIFIREGGSIIFQKPRNTTTASRRESFRIYMFMNETGYSKGELYWDDGISLDSYEKGLYSVVEMSTQNSMFISEPASIGYQDFLKVEILEIQEVPVKPSSVKMNGKDVSFKYDQKALIINAEWSLLEKCVVTWQ